MFTNSVLPLLCVATGVFFKVRDVPFSRGWNCKIDDHRANDSFLARTHDCVDDERSRQIYSSSVSRQTNRGGVADNAKATRHFSDELHNFRVCGNSSYYRHLCILVRLRMAKTGNESIVSLKSYGVQAVNLIAIEIALSFLTVYVQQRFHGMRHKSMFPKIKKKQKKSSKKEKEGKKQWFGGVRGFLEQPPYAFYVFIWVGVCIIKSPPTWSAVNFTGICAREWTNAMGPYTRFNVPLRIWI